MHSTMRIIACAHSRLSRLQAPEDAGLVGAGAHHDDRQPVREVRVGPQLLAHLPGTPTRREHFGCQKARGTPNSPARPAVPRPAARPHPGPPPALPTAGGLRHCCGPDHRPGPGRRTGGPGAPRRSSGWAVTGILGPGRPNRASWVHRASADRFIRPGPSRHEDSSGRAGPDRSVPFRSVPFRSVPGCSGPGRTGPGLWTWRGTFLDSRKDVTSLSSVLSICRARACVG